jgi:hypothetical protein
MERAKNERVEDVFKDSGNEGARIQYPAGIASDTSEPEYDKEVLGDESGRIRGVFQCNKPDDSANGV